MHAADNRRAHHRKRWWVNTIGNMWLLDAGTNRALQDREPETKFELLEGWLGATPEAHQVWPLANWSITRSEIRKFNGVDTDIDHDIDGAMNAFADLVRARGDRLLEKPFEMLPDAKLFARDTEPESPDDWSSADTLPPELAERLRPPKPPPPPDRPSDEVPSPVPWERRPILQVPRRWGWHSLATALTLVPLAACP